MKHTKEQLQGMSDFERNKVLAELTKSSHLSTKKNDIFVDCVDIVNTLGQVLKTVDYMNNYSDVMPLAFKYITLIQELKDGWYVESKSKDVWCWSFIDKSPMRAIVCCLILVLQDKE
jgi:hypothetical protein